MFQTFMLAMVVGGFIVYLRWFEPAFRAQKELNDYQRLKWKLERLLTTIKREATSVDWEGSRVKFVSDYGLTDHRKELHNLECRFSFKDGRLFTLYCGHFGAYETLEISGTNGEPVRTEYRVPSDIDLRSPILDLESAYEALKEKYYWEPKEDEKRRCYEFQREIWAQMPQNERAVRLAFIEFRTGLLEVDENKWDWRDLTPDEQCKDNEFRRRLKEFDDARGSRFPVKHDCMGDAYERYEERFDRTFQRICERIRRDSKE